MEIQNDNQILDWDRLIGRWGDEELIKEIVPIFITDNRERLDKLKKAVELGDADAIAMSAHALKGAGKNFEADQLVEIAGLMECAAREGDLAAATSLLEQLETAVENVLMFLLRPDWIEAAKCQRVFSNQKTCIHKT